MKTEIQIPVAELKLVLPGLAKIAGHSRSLPVLDCIRVESDKQSICLQANNLDEIATVRLLNNENSASGTLLVPLDMLTKIVKACSAEQSVRLISNSQETKIRYHVAGSPVDRSVDHISPKEWPPVKVITQEAFPLDDTFKQALKEAMDCASEDSSRYVLNGACLDIRDKAAHYLVGTDGRHLYAANSFAFGIPEPLIIQTRKFVTWPGFVNDGPWKLRMLPAVKSDPKDKEADRSKDEPPWLQIESDRWTYIARAIDGDFPNWKHVVPPTNGDWTRITLEDSAMQTIVGAIPLLPGADAFNQPVSLEITNVGLVLKARGRDQKDWTSIPVGDVSVSGKPVEISLNRIYLVKALRFGFNQIQILSSDEPLVLTNGGKTLVIMPLRESPETSAANPVNPSPSPIENTAAASPSTAPVDNATEIKTQTMSTPAMIAPERGNLRATNNGNGEGDENRSSFKAALEHIERIKINLRDALSDLALAVSMLKAAEKEQRATTKEIDTVRSKLREIQSVKL
jgi:DNA polymerase III sliding clamp (beta) subunit (PCNA family)